jgi:hypothetical protein
MVSRILLFAIVIGGFYFLLFGLSDARIDGFQRWRHVWIGRFHTVETTTKSEWKQIK